MYLRVFPKRFLNLMIFFSFETKYAGQVPVYCPIYKKSSKLHLNFVHTSFVCKKALTLAVVNDEVVVVDAVVMEEHR